MAATQDFDCTEGIKYRRCVLVDYHPSGSMVIIDSIKNNEILPFKRSITGVRSGASILGRLQVIYNSDGNWTAKINNNNKIISISNKLALFNAVKFNFSGYNWEMVVLSREAPIYVEGVANEAEPKLNIEIYRK